jgi:hypothetical protein
VSRVVVSLDVIDDRSSQESNDRDPHYLALLGRATYIHSTSTRDQAQRSGTADGWERKPGHRALALALAIAKGEEGVRRERVRTTRCRLTIDTYIHTYIHTYTSIHTCVRAPTIPPRGNYIPRGSLFVEERRGLRQASFYIGTDIHGIGRWPCPVSQEVEGKNRWWRRWAWLTKSRFNRRTIYQLIASGRHTRLPIARSRLSPEPPQRAAFQAGVGRT